MREHKMTLKNLWRKKAFPSFSKNKGMSIDPLIASFGTVASAFAISLLMQVNSLKFDIEGTSLDIDYCFNDANHFIEIIEDDKDNDIFEGKNRLVTRYTRDMTENENFLAFLFFDGPTLAPFKNQIHEYPKSCGNILASAWGFTNIGMTKGLHAKDYTLTQDSAAFGVFMHELTHIWQFRSFFEFTKIEFDEREDKYSYDPDPDTLDFSDYGKEQQGAMIEDYALYFLNEDEQLFYLESSETNIENLRILIENQFPGAKVAREFFEDYGLLPTRDNIEILKRYFDQKSGTSSSPSEPAVM